MKKENKIKNVRIKLLDPSFIDQFVQEFEGTYERKSSLMQEMFSLQVSLVLELKLISPTGQVLNLDTGFLILTEINIFEDIFSHSVMGNCNSCRYHENLYTKVPIHGQERLYMKIQTPSPDF